MAIGEAQREWAKEDSGFRPFELRVSIYNGCHGKLEPEKADWIA